MVRKEKCRQVRDFYILSVFDSESQVTARQSWVHSIWPSSSLTRSSPSTPEWNNNYYQNIGFYHLHPSLRHQQLDSGKGRKVKMMLLPKGSEQTKSDKKPSAEWLWVSMWEGMIWDEAKEGGPTKKEQPNTCPTSMNRRLASRGSFSVTTTSVWQVTNNWRSRWDQLSAHWTT